ncbi:MAG TPA: 1,4-dihydroxy-2-naphthoate polyprenyltransferase [Ignavibacteriaceae bacterium]|nr:1,4-dihydroxy-2-naphthoate polyprenyltransferase [Ignavibacteriaceae bacterium]
MDNEQPTKFQSWVIASRPKTLPAAVAPVLVGSALAYNQGKFHIELSIIALICSFLIQIATNFSNDLYDFLKGADTAKRKGPRRVLASGLITVKEMKLAVFITFMLAFIFGLYLVYRTDYVVLIIGVLSIIAGLAYTAGPFPLAYNGLGDIFVFIFFGVIGTAGTYYLHHLEINALSLAASIPVGTLITNILVVNNYRDINEDKEAGKNTLAVILGKTFSRYQLIFSLIIAYLIPLFLLLYYNFNLWILLPYVSLPIAILSVIHFYRNTGIELNKTLALTAQLSAIYGLLFSIGIIL